MAAATAVVLVAGGVITAFAVSFHYLHAPVLSTNGGGWVAPSGASAQQVQAGPYSASILELTPGKWETFEVDVYNSSDVTQTILGLTDAAELGNAQMKAEPERLTIASGYDRTTATFGTKPVTLNPHQSAMLELSILASRLNASPCKSESWQDISLQVRVGAFTRTEDVSFNNLIWELRYPGKC
jgi:hypothetical protein